MSAEVGDFTLEPDAAIRPALFIYVIVVAGIVVPFQLLWDLNPLRMAFHAVGGWPVALFLFVPLGVVAHELLHAMGWALGSGGWRHVRFGMNPRKLMVYAHYEGPLPVRRYQFGSALPGVSMGLIPSLLGAAFGNGIAAGWGALFLGFAAGDFLVLWTIRGVKPPALVLDHPSKPGCRVVAADAGARF